METEIYVLREVKKIIGTTLKIPSEKLDVDAEFESFGMDSIVAMELMSNLSKALGISISPAQFTTVSTIRELAEFIDSEFDIDSEKIENPVSVLLPKIIPKSGLTDYEALHAHQQTSEIQENKQHFEHMLQFIKKKYSVDLSYRDWSSIDEIIDELTSNNLDALTLHYDIAKELSSNFDKVEVADSSTVDGNEPFQLKNLDIAIVGISCKFPDAKNYQAFWDNLLNERNSIQEIPGLRWDWKNCHADTITPGKTVSKWGALIDEIDCFDPEFFKLTPYEAKLMDPQERLLIQEVYKAVQDAGIDIEKLSGSNTGVFVGYEYAEYEQYLRQNIKNIPNAPQLSSSSPTYYLANRLSYIFNFCGPSEAININCSSSAVAINRAYYSLLNNESDLAIASGVCLNLFANDYIAASQHGFLSANGTCAVFDENANGYTRGEGVGVVVLKRLSDAKREKSRIYGVIKSCHQNNRGNANSLSDVKYEAVTDVITRCYSKAAINRDTVNYIEVNGYAKKWADSFEFEGIKNAFKDPRSKDLQATEKYCALGSLKGNIGHLEPVNGIASVIKVALSLHNKKFPATITKKKMSSFIDIDNPAHPLYFADSIISFAEIRKNEMTPIRAGVNSFADSGTNIHILLEEYIDEALTASSSTSANLPNQQLFILSAKNLRRLDEYVETFIDFLSTNEDADFSSLTYTLQVGRQAMEERLAIIVASRQDLIEKLSLLKKSGLSEHMGLEKKGIFYGNTNQAGKNPLISLITQDMTNKQLELSVQTAQWQQVALLWVNGFAIPWASAWKDTTMKPVSLPGYPFAKERYWLDLNSIPEFVIAPTKPSALSASVDEKQEVTVEMEWQFSLSNDSEINSADEQSKNSMQPVETVTQFLKQEIAQQLHCTFLDISGESSFINLGLNSIGIAELIHKTNNLLQINLSPSVVFKYQDVEALAEYLVNAYPQKTDKLIAFRQIDPEKIRSSSGIFSPEQKKSIVSKQVSSSNNASAFDILIPMHTKGTETPIFAVPGADGSVLSLQQLSEALGNSQPFYGLEATGLDGISQPMESVEDTAKANIAALKTIQAHGPYRLLGYSNGGVVVYAMANILLEQGEKVSSLMLLDSLCPSARHNNVVEEIVDVFKHSLSTLGGSSDLDVDKLEKIPEEQRGEYLYNIMASQGFALSREQFIASYRVGTASEQCCRNYKLAKLSQKIDVSLFRAVDGYTDAPRDYGWNQLLLKPIRIFDIQANHFSIIDKNPIKEVAEKITLLANKPRKK